jgi:tetratricopeptide (TPR) repeat protein
MTCGVRSALKWANMFLVNVLLCAGCIAFCAPSCMSADNGATAAGAPQGEKREPYKREAIEHYNRGHDLHQQGFFNQAILEYKAALVADDRLEEAYTNLGLIYAAQKNYGKAMDSFKKALELRPGRPTALNGLGTVLYARNHFDEAMEKWHEAVKADPNFASAYYNMGNALESEKDLKGAVDAYVQAIGVNPRMADAYYRVGNIFAKQKHAPQAALLLSKAITLAGDTDPPADFFRDAKRTLDSLQSQFAHEDADAPDVKMNVITPPSTSGAPAATPGASAATTDSGSTGAEKSDGTDNTSQDQSK